MPHILSLVFLFVVSITVLIVAVYSRKLTFPAALLALVIGVSVYIAAQDRGVILLLVFFALGVLATSHKKELKAKVEDKGDFSKARDSKQVFANGGIAAMLAIPSFFDPGHAYLYGVMLAASLASALADTLSSELGMVYGKRFFNVLSFKKEPRGLDGVISLEGTLIGAAGACIIGLIYAGLSKISFFIALAGVIGNLIDSVLGAALERKHYIGNNLVNFLNTLCAALAVFMLYYFLE